MTWWLFSVVANACFITTEYFNRGSTTGWPLIQTLPLTILGQYCLFRSFNGASSWLVASMTFSVGNALFRLVAVRFFGNEVSSWPHAVAGTAVMLLGAWVLKGALK